MAGALRVLVVDDSQIISERLLLAISDIQNVGSIRTGSNYDQAIDLIDSEPFDVVILDINLPGKSGIDILQYIKAVKIAPRKVIMMTDEPSFEKMEVCNKLSADHFIYKFRDFQKIFDLISDMTEGNPQMRSCLDH